MPEYDTLQSFDKPLRQQEGTLFTNDTNIGINVGELSRQESIANALADAQAAIQPAQSTQPLIEAVQKRIEYTPLSPQEVVKMIGRKVVFDLRKGYNDTHIVLDEEPDLSKPYIYSPEAAEASQSTDAQVFQFPPSGEFDQHAESDTNTAVRADAA